MCRPIFAQGSHDLCVGEEPCEQAKRTGVSCMQRNAVPLNEAARRAQRGAAGIGVGGAPSVALARIKAHEKRLNDLFGK